MSRVEAVRDAGMDQQALRGAVARYSSQLCAQLADLVDAVDSSAMRLLSAYIWP